MRIHRALFAICTALIMAVQISFTAVAVASETEQIFHLYSDGKTDLYDGLEFGDNDWAALCHIRLYGVDGAGDYLSSVRSSAEQLMASDGFVKPTELQRASLILSAAGEYDSKLICAAVYNNEKLDRQGMNAYIWALIAANCYAGEVPSDTLNTTMSLAAHLISAQLPDGGFSLKGTAADTDITAAVIYALAPLCEDAEISEAVTRAEQCLRGLQSESGGYSSMGIENCESSAQVVIALTALGCGAEDADVKAALEAVMSYKTDGGYSHLPDGEANGTATVQALLALTALELQKTGQSLYEQPSVSAVPDNEQSALVQEQLPQAEPVIEASDSTVTGGTLKLIIGGVLMTSGAALLVVLLVLKKRALLILPVLLCAGGTAVMLLDISTPDEYYSAQAGGGMQVMVSVDCSAALGYDTAVLLPENGKIVSAQQVSLHEGASAFDALIEAAKAQRLRVDYTDGIFGEYVSGIGGLSEFDCGSESGWLYEVNGVRPSVSSGAYVLSDGDEVTFLYTCTIGSPSQ